MSSPVGSAARRWHRLAQDKPRHNQLRTRQAAVEARVHASWLRLQQRQRARMHCSLTSQPRPQSAPDTRVPGGAMPSSSSLSYVPCRVPAAGSVQAGRQGSGTGWHSGQTAPQTPLHPVLLPPPSSQPRRLLHTEPSALSPCRRHDAPAVISRLGRCIASCTSEPCFFSSVCTQGIWGAHGEARR